MINNTINDAKTIAGGGKDMVLLGIIAALLPTLTIRINLFE